MTAESSRNSPGRPTKLLPAQRRDLVSLYDAGTHDLAEISRIFAVSRATVRRVVQQSDREILGLDAAGSR